MSWYLSAWVTCQTLVSRAVVGGSDVGRRFVYCRDEKKRPRVAALFELSRPKMEMVIQLRYSFVVKHLPEMCLGLCNFRT